MEQKNKKKGGSFLVEKIVVQLNGFVAFSLYMINKSQSFNIFYKFAKKTYKVRGKLG